MIDVLAYILTVMTLALGAGVLVATVYVELADWRDAPARKEGRRVDAEHR